MRRKTFLKGILPTAIGVAAGGHLIAENEQNKALAIEQVGFNHLPNPTPKRMEKLVLHRANTRGSANHGWLQANHSFSFANYYDPERMNFGVLRVLNDDTIAAGMGFGTHPHDNMEIITIPLEGEVKHQDSMGNTGVITSGEVQVMSAGTGIKHSEFNNLADAHLKLFQIWLFPNKRSVTPRYEQLKYELVQNAWTQILSPNADDDGVWIYQDAWFSMGRFDQNLATAYELKKPATNGVYAMVVEGSATINGQELTQRDAVGVWGIEQLAIQTTAADTRILLLEVPMANS
jgi:quercetin 2,3-dioxygenase